MTEQPPPGFYADPDDPSFERWWSGDSWGEQRRASQQSSGDGTTARSIDFFGVDLGIALALVLPPLGIVSGLVIATRPGKTSSGLTIVLMAVLVLAAWIAVLG
ncbi:hypothetical protein GCM10022215_29460 [Nocardioides fonticola]|uniref:DUF2510 domain-containing protein n=1 Tax=Nocardioides fonticola TaxID=450363 RepID=A0ABP7XP37_9ACTN